MAMAVMDDYLDSPMEPEEVFPCKGCGEILEEGKAFELAGNRWHLDCFRCNTCNTLLDSDANLLLLGDGSLICNNCTYSCSACGNKIEDLAILTGDQAFCATCFRCRNCKRKIENLRYARTSQGIFCMNCHESLMARRRKKAKAAAQKAREKESPVITDKSLPALPSHVADSALASFGPAELEASNELSPPPSRPAYGRNDSSQSSVHHPDMSPERASDAYKGALAPPPNQNYRKNRNSVMLSGDLTSGGDGDGFYIPVALDPSPAPSVTPTPRSATDASPDASTRTSVPSGKQDNQDNQTSAPHIAFQEKPRASSSDYDSTPHELPARSLSKRKLERGAGEERTVLNGKPTLNNNNNNNNNNNEFKLQDAPKSRRLVASKNSSPPSGLENGAPGKGFGGQQRPKDLVSLMKTDTASMVTSDSMSTSRSSADSRRRDEDEGGRHPATDSRPEAASQPTVRKEAALGASRNASGNAKPIVGPTVKTVGSEDLLPPPRPGLPDHKLTETYMLPRAAPQPPAHAPKEPTNAANTNPANQNSEGKTSPKLPRWSAGGDFSMDEDMARILGTDEGSSSIMRRVSNAVQHGRHSSAEAGHPTGRLGHSRSVSETTRGTTSPRWPRTPIAEDPQKRGHEISSPVSMSGASHEDSALLRRQLRSSEQRVAELERKFHTENDLKTLNKKVMERRKTVSVLDTQTEIMIRQLEVLAGYVERAKKTKEMLDPRELEDSALKEFVQKLDKLKHSMAGQIEQLHAERDDLLEDKNQAMADRDRALLEFEQLSSKNAQLADMNNDLTHQIQERFKQQINHGDGGKATTNGLGIYSHSKGVSTASINLLDSTMSMHTGTTLVGTDAEEPVVEGPTLVNMRKGQVKKFNWKKGSSKVAHNITKGINRAAVAFQQQDQPRAGPHGNLTGDNIGLPYNMTVAQMESPMTLTQITAGPPPPPPARAGIDNSRQGFGFFSKKPTNPMNQSMNMNMNMSMNKSLSAASVSVPAIAEAPSTLFGSDLVERADFEHLQIPSVVTRCIEEVELRGMDVEGIYRKTGGNSQVKMIQEGFDRNMDYDISDPALDITAVTSVLKQYFRKLPIPLLTFDVYERILESNNMASDTDRCNHLRATVNMLPQKHRDCLEFLMFHLARVAGRERENLMSPKNLAVVFAPTIMRDHSLEKEMTDMHAKNIAVQFVIEHSHTIFSDA